MRVCMRVSMCVCACLYTICVCVQALHTYKKQNNKQFKNIHILTTNIEQMLTRRRKRFKYACLLFYISLKSIYQSKIPVQFS